MEVGDCWGGAIISATLHQGKHAANHNSMASGLLRHPTHPTHNPLPTHPRCTGCSWGACRTGSPRSRPGSRG